MFTNGLSLAFQLFLLLQIGRFFLPGLMNDQKPFFGVSSSFFFSAGRTSACWIWDTIAGILLFTISPVLRRRPNVSMTVSNNSSFLSSSRHNESMRDCCSGDFTYLFSVCNMLQTLSFFVW